MSDLEDLIREAAAVGIGAFNLFRNPNTEGYQANVANQRTGSYGIKSAEDPIVALKAALKHGIAKAPKKKKKTAEDLL